MLLEICADRKPRGSLLGLPPSPEPRVSGQKRCGSKVNLRASRNGVKFAAARDVCRAAFPAQEFADLLGNVPV